MKSKVNIQATNPTAATAYEPLDYSAENKIIRRKSSLPSYWTCVSLSNGSVAILRKDDDDIYLDPGARTSGNNSICVLCLDKNDEFQETVLSTGDFFSIGSFADRLFTARRAQNSIIVDIWDLNKPLNEQYVQSINLHSTSRCIIVGLSQNTFAAVNISEETIKIWDLSKPKEQECIKILTHLKVQPSSLIPLSETQFICANPSAHAPSMVLVYDITQPDGMECIRKIPIDTDFRYVRRLTNGYVAYVSFRQYDHTLKGESIANGQITLLDLKQPAGREQIQIIKIDCDERLNDIVALPNGHIAAFGHSSWLRIYNTESLPKLPSVHIDKVVRDGISESIHAEDLNVQKDGQLVLLSKSGKYIVHKFPPLKPKPNEGVEEELRSSYTMRF